MSSHHDSRDHGRLRLWPIGLLFIPTLAFANGTPIARSDVASTSSIAPVGSQGVALRQETLQIAIDGDWATVHAAYRFFNAGSARSIAYGFRIDHHNPDLCNDCDDVSDEEKIRVGKPVRDVRMVVNGATLTTREVAEPPPAADAPLPEFLRTWIIADLPLAERENVVAVSYRVRNGLSDMHWSTSFAPEFSKRKFAYVLSPSGNWGDGVVPELDITVDLTKLTQFGGKLTAIAPTGYTQEGQQLRWRLTDADLRRFPDLRIEYDDSARLLSEYIAERRLPANVIASTRASSTLGAHDIAKLLDGDLSSAWCEGIEGDGAGQTLTFEFKPGVTVDAIGVLNGYTKSAAIFRGNGRATKLSAVTSTRGKPESSQKSVSLPERDFAQLNTRALAPFIDWIVDDPYSGEMRQVTLTIDAVKSGTKHADTCLSEIYFIGAEQGGG